MKNIFAISILQTFIFSILTQIQKISEQYQNINNSSRFSYRKRSVASSDYSTAKSIFADFASLASNKELSPKKRESFFTKGKWRRSTVNAPSIKIDQYSNADTNEELNTYLDENYLTVSTAVSNNSTDSGSVRKTPKLSRSLTERPVRSRRSKYKDLDKLGIINIERNNDVVYTEPEIFLKRHRELPDNR